MSTKNISIAKGLKVKNRIIGEINRLKQIAARENSRRSDSVSKIEVNEIFLDLTTEQSKLIEVKSQLAKASAPIAHLLAEISEKKDMIKWVGGLDTREGVETVRVYGAAPNEVKNLIWLAHVNQARQDAWVKEIQTRIDELQDEIDRYNAQTTFDLTF
jgi:hypothetical protein